MVWPLRIAKALQAQQPEPLKVLHSHPVVVLVAQTLVAHAAQPHAYPRVEFMEDFPSGEPLRGEVLSRASYDSVEFHKDLTVQVVLSAGQFSHFVFEFLQ